MAKTKTSKYSKIEMGFVKILAGVLKADSGSVGSGIKVAYKLQQVDLIPKQFSGKVKELLQKALPELEELKKVTAITDAEERRRRLIDLAE